MKALGATFADNGNSDYFHIFSPHKEYIITKFQRDYTWGDYQTQGIIADIEYILQTDSSVGWPSILIQKEETDNPNISSYSLGDGQQRLTSVALMLIAIWQRGHTLIDSPNYDGDLVQDKAFLEKIISLKTGEGIVAKQVYTERGVKVDPIIKFQLKSANEAFRRLCTRLNEDSWDTIDRSIHKNEQNVKLHTAFKKYYNYLYDKELNIVDLQALYFIITNKLMLTVMEYSHDEDMQRSFSNMNSFGVPLQENELIKADFYGLMKLHDPDFANKIADDWTDIFNAPYWKQLSKNNSSLLDYCLEQVYNSYGHWRTKDRSSKEKHNPHELRDNWRKFLQPKTGSELRELWEEIKSSFEVCKIVHDSKSYFPDTLNWELKYNYQIYSSFKSTSALSFILHLHRTISKKKKLSPAEKETKIIQILRTYTKYLVSIMMSYADYSVVSNSLVSLYAAIIRGEDLYTDNNFEKHLESLNDYSNKWNSYDEAVEIISKTSYPNKMNPALNEIFIYVQNEEKRAKGDISGLANTSDIENFFEIIKTREHIIPQKPKQRGQDSKIVDEYNFTINMIGNALLMDSKVNSRLSNKPITDKVLIYEEVSGVFEYWAKDFLSYYRQEKFDIEDIQLRSMLIAERFAKVISPKNPNLANPKSKFKSLLSSHAPDTKLFYIGEDKLWHQLVLAEDGTLINEDGTKCLFVADLGLTTKQNWKNQLHTFDGKRYIPITSSRTN